MWTIKKVNIEVFLYSVIFFFVFFNPPFLPHFSFTIIFTLIAGVYCLFNFHKVLNFLNTKNIKEWICILITFYVFYLCFSFYSSFAYNFLTSPITIFFKSLLETTSLMVVTVFLCLIVFKKNRNIDFFFEIIIFAGLIESIFGILAFIKPEIKQFLNGLTIANTRSEKIASSVANAYFRNYGIASTLYDTFGFGMSIIALISFYKVLNGKIKYIIYFCMIAFVAVINSRTSIVLIGVGTILLFLTKRSKNKTVLICKCVSALIVIFSVIILGIYIGEDKGNSQWISKGLEEIRSLLGGKATGTFAILIYDVSFPEKISQIIFGIGLTSDYVIDRTMDVGYFNNIWLFGIIGSMVFYIYLFYPIAVLKNKRNKIKKLATPIEICMLLFLFKLNLFGYGINTVILTTLLMGILYSLSNGLYSDNKGVKYE